MHQTPPNFNLIARSYRTLEYLALGRALERCRLHYIPQLGHHRRALVLGDGDGRFLAHLLVHNPHIVVDAVDASAAMLHLLHRNCERGSPDAHLRLRAHHTDALTFTPAGTYDLVVSHFFLDCLTQPELETLITRIAPALAPQAIWLISDFRIPAGPLRLPAHFYIRTLYLAFRILTGLRTTSLPDHAAALHRAGFRQLSQHHSIAGLLTSELWQLSGR